MLREYSKKFLALDCFMLGFVLVNGWAMYWDYIVEDAVIPAPGLNRFLGAVFGAFTGGDPGDFTLTIRGLSIGVFFIVLLILAVFYRLEFHQGGKAVRLRYFLTVLLITACFLAEFFFHRVVLSPLGGA